MYASFVDGLYLNQHMPLGCSHCKVWVHVGFGELVEENIVFMKNRSKHGFCYYCDTWQGGPDASRAAQSLANIEDRVARRLYHRRPSIFQLSRLLCSIDEQL